MATEYVAKMITVADLARMRGRHPSSTRRWLLDVDAKHGGGIALRVGTGRNARLYTTAPALARVAPHLVDPQADLREQFEVMQRDVDALTHSARALMARTRDLAERVIVLEKRRA